MRQFTNSKLLVAFLMMLCCGTAMASDFVTVDGFKFLVDTDKDEATLLANDYSGEVVVPEKVTFEGKDYPVTTFGPNCFGRNVLKVTIPLSVRTISDYCFQNAGIEEIKLPSSLTELGAECFKGSLLKEIEIPSSITSIGGSCFRSCQKLKKVNLPNSLSCIPIYCFDSCYRLEDIVIPSSITYIDSYAFRDCNLSSIVLPESLEYLGQYDVFGGNPMDEIVLPAGLKNISNRVFGHCENLKRVVCKAKTPLSPEKNQIFDDFNPIECILEVPGESIELYKNDRNWGMFGVIKAIDGEDEEAKSCSIPTIAYTFGNLSFESSTPGAEYHYTIKDVDVATDKYNTGGKVQLNGKLDISVYATADGYKASDKATATLYWLNAEGGDDTNNINLVKTRGVMVMTDSDITISGLNDGEVVTFYSVNGVNLGSAKAVQGVLHFAKPNESLVIAKIKGNDLKIAIK